MICASWKLAVAASLTVISHTLAAPLIVHPGGVKDIVITTQNTVNGTEPEPLNLHGAPPISKKPAESAASAQQLEFQFVNNIASGQVNAYFTGTDTAGAVVMLQPDGTFYYPQAGGSSTPVPISGDVAIPLGSQGSTISITTPDYISSARVYLAVGDLQFFAVGNAGGTTDIVQPSSNNPQDPNAGIQWAFLEMDTSASGGLYADISYVDLVGLPLAMTLSTASDGSQSGGGLNSDAVANICSSLQAQSNSDGQPWGDMCDTDANGNDLRVIAPIDYISVVPDAFSGYWTEYVTEVFTYYETNTLTIDTQAAAGQVACTVTGGTLNCAGDNRGYAMPDAQDIFGCNSGPFAIEAGDNDVHYAVVPRLCAAFNRGTLLLDGGNVQPSLSASSYYTTAPSNYFSAFVHQQETSGVGYAFSYDDVTPDGGVNQSGTVADANPTLLSVTVG